MKKRNLFILMTLLAVFGISKVSAKEVFFTNMNGVELTEEEYNNLLKGFSPDTINTMDKEMIDGIKDSKHFYVAEDKKYIKTTEVFLEDKLVDTFDEEITEEEFENSDSEETPLYTPIGTATTSTSYRKLTLHVTAGSSISSKYVTLTNTWTKMPSMKSYDVLAIAPGAKSMSFNLNGHRSAYQKYDSEIINYDMNGDKWNIIESDTIWKKGIGISQNLVDAATTSIENSMTVVFLCGEYPFSSKGAYAHAIKDTSLDKSKNYTLGTSGIGGLIVFNSSVKGNYEDSVGLEAVWDLDDFE